MLKREKWEVGSGRLGQWGELKSRGPGSGNAVWALAHSKGRGHRRNFDQLITILRELDTSLKGQVIRTANVGLTLRNWLEGKKVRQRLAFPAVTVVNNPDEAPLKRRSFDQMVGKGGVFANPVFLKADLYRIKKLVNSVNTAGRNRCETV